MKTLTPTHGICILTILLIIDGIFPESSSKVLVRAIIWLTLCLLPYYNINKLRKDTKYSYYLISLSLCYTILLTIRSIFFDGNNAILGNPILSLFGNTSFGVLPFLLPLFSLYGFSFTILSTLKNIIITIFTCSTIIYLFHLLFFNSDSFALITTLHCACFIFIYIDYINKGLRTPIFIGSGIILLGLWQISERALFLMFLLSFFAYWLVHYKTSKKLLMIYSFTLVFLSISITLFALYYGISIFEEIPKILSNTTGEISQDSRTFLFIEFREDFNHAQSWIFGKGLLGSYYSEIMDKAQSLGLYSDNANRVGVEVGFLQYILKGGILALLIYILILWTAIFRAIKFSKNKFMQIVALIIASRFFVSCIGEYPWFNLYNVFIWIFIGMTFSKKMLSISDLEIKTLLTLTLQKKDTKCQLK